MYCQKVSSVNFVNIAKLVSSLFIRTPNNLAIKYIFFETLLVFTKQHLGIEPKIGRLTEWNKDKRYINKQEMSRNKKCQAQLLTQLTNHSSLKVIIFLVGK